MKMSSRAKRRIAVLIAIVVFFSVAIASLYLYQSARKQKRAEQNHQQGIAAYEAGDYRQAVQHLKPYVDRHGDDAETLHKYAKARLNVPMENNGHIAHAMQALRKVVELQPQNTEAGHELLKLYTLTGRSNPAIVLADQLLAINPNDVEALTAKATALSDLERLTDALAAAQRAVELEPGRWQMHMLSLQLMRRLDMPSDEIVQRARELQKAHPEEAPFKMVLAFAYGLAGDEQQSRHWLETAAKEVTADSTFVTSMVRFLDGGGLYPQSLKVLQQVASADGDLQLFMELIRRQFEAGNYAQIIDAVEVGDLTSPATRDARIEQAGILAMALHEAKRKAEADAVRQQLANVAGSTLASSWVALLDALYGEDSNPAQIVKATQAAIKPFPNHPYFQALLGDAYAQLGEQELALPAWQRASEIRPSWAMPRVRQAQVMADRGELAKARAMAEAALLRQPNNVQAMVTWASIRAAQVDAGEERNAAEVLTLLDRLQQVLPQEQRTRVLKAALLAKLGQTEQAAQAIQETLHEVEPLSEQTLRQLAQLSKQYDLGLDQALEQRLDASYGDDPDELLRDAVRLANAGDVEQGRSLLQAKLDRNDAVAWQLAYARFLEAIGDAEAAAKWTELADAHPQDPRIQRLALHSIAGRTDAELATRALQRIRTATGSDSLIWRLERARWLLTGPQASRNPTEAGDLLREVIAQSPSRVEAHILLAQAQQQLGLYPLAIRELRAAVQLAPQSSAVRLELARLQQDMRHFRSAREELEYVVSSELSTDAQLRQAAVMLTDQGQASLAVRVLEQLRAESDDGDSWRWQDDLLLARLYRQLGDLQKMQPLVASLASIVAPEAVTFVADVYAAQGNTEQAQATLEQLADANLTDADRMTLLGNHAARHGQTQQALDDYQQAAEADPTNADRWRRVVTLHVARGQAESAVAVARKGLEHAADDPGLKQVVDHAGLYQRFAGQRIPQLVLQAMLNDEREGHRSLATSSLETLAAGLDRGDSYSTLARALREQADAHPDCLPVQLLSVQAYLQAGRGDDAAEIANRAMDNFPNATEPAWLATQAYAAGRRWDRLILAAQEWARRLGTNRMPADLMIAQARLELNRPREAMEQISPYLAAAQAAPDRYPQVIALAARLLLAQNKHDAAAALLKPLLNQASHWRTTWMQLAATSIRSPQVAANWLAQVAPMLAADGTDEQLRLAQSWWLLANRTRQASYMSHAKQTLDAILQRSDAPAEAWYLNALMAEHDNNPAEAEQGYRRALELQSDLHVAQNNLAMVILNRQGDLSEAITLAEQAVEAVPASAAYHDTLAQVLVAAGRYDDAIEAIEKAIELEPGNATWRENLARMLAEKERHKAQSSAASSPAEQTP